MLNLLYSAKSYRGFLQAELDHRKKENPSYSLRAFARKINLSPSFLSDLLKYKTTLSASKSTQVIKSLGGDADDEVMFRSMIQYEQATDPQEKLELEAYMNQILERQKLKNIDLDNFNVIANWYHLAILELFQLKGVSYLTTEIVASKLGIHETEALRALKRLNRLKLILSAKDEKFILNSESHVVGGNNISSEAIKLSHIQLLEKAKSNIERLSPELREVQSYILATNSEMRKKIVRLTRKYCNEIISIASENGEKDQVDVFGIHFSPLTK